MIASRLLIALATLRLTAREVAELRRFFQEHPTSKVLEMLHTLEDDIEDGRIAIRDLTAREVAPVIVELESRLRQIYQGELGVPATSFMNALVEAATSANFAVSKFDPKKGVRNWLTRNLKSLPPSEVLRFATVVRSSPEEELRSWRLR